MEALFFADSYQVGDILHGIIEGVEKTSQKFMRVEIPIAKIYDIHPTSDRLTIMTHTHRISWIYNLSPAVYRVAQRTIEETKTLVYQVATQINVDIWVDGNNRGPDQWRNIHELYVWNDTPFIDADVSSGCCWIPG